MKAQRVVKLFLLLGVLSLHLSLHLSIHPGFVLAEYISPGSVSVKTERYEPTATEFETGTYTYDVSWQGIPVGTAKVEVKGREVENKPYLHVTATARTASFIEIFYRLRHTSESVFDARSLKPWRFFSHQKERSKVKTREITFGDDGTIRSVSTKNGKIGQEVEFSSDNLTLDPISAAFIARTLPTAPGKEFSFDVFNGKHRYLISFAVGGLEEISVRGQTYQAYRVVPEVQKLTDTKGENRLKSAAIWISADNNHEVLEMKSKVLIGSVSAKLVDFTPRGRRPAAEDQQLQALLRDSKSAGERGGMPIP